MTSKCWVFDEFAATAAALPGTDHCLLSTLNITCRSHEHVRILTAQLGRMRASHCLTDSQNMGCVDNVTTQVQAMCSQSHCNFFVGSLGQYVRDCPPSSMPFLYVHHECLAGEDGGTGFMHIYMAVC